MKVLRVIFNKRAKNENFCVRKRKNKDEIEIAKNLAFRKTKCTNKNCSDKQLQNGEIINFRSGINSIEQEMLKMKKLITDTI